MPYTFAAKALVALVLALGLAGAGMWGGMRIERAGWQAKEAARLAQEQKLAAERRDRTQAASYSFEATRTTIERERDAARRKPRTEPPIRCVVDAASPAVDPAPVFTRDALDRLRRAAGELPEPAADPGEPRPTGPEGSGLSFGR